VAKSIRAKIDLNKSRRVEREVAARLDAARRLAGKQIVEQVAEEVRDMIPNRGGWYAIYREAIQYFSSSDGTKWAASGLWPKSSSEFPADTTLIEFSLGVQTVGDPNKVTEALVAYNPWTVDRLPALNGGIQAEAKAKPASAAEVTAQRDRLLAAADAIKQLLLAAGATYVNEVPTIQGKVYADVAFMAKCLEHGLAGFPRTPHWVKALRQVQQDARSLVEPAKDQVQRVLDGKERVSDKGSEMPPGLAAKIGLDA
jgi:hypothetical protein